MNIKKKKTVLSLKNILLIGPMPISASLKRGATLKKRVEMASAIFFIDGGTKHYSLIKKLGPRPTAPLLSLGDGDSSNQTLDILKSDQELSDLAFFLKNIKKFSAGSEGPDQLNLYGFSGKRIDHELFNYGEIFSFQRKIYQKTKKQIQITMDEKAIFLTAGKHRVNLSGIYSVLSFKKVKLKMTGNCRYPLRKWTALAPLSSQGLSNEGHGVVQIETHDSLIVIAHPN